MSKKELTNNELKTLCKDLISKIDQLERMSNFMERVRDYSDECISSEDRLISISLPTVIGLEEFNVFYDSSNYHLMYTMLDNTITVIAEDIYTLRKQIGINK